MFINILNIFLVSFIIKTNFIAVILLLKMSYCIFLSIRIYVHTHMFSIKLCCATFHPLYATQRMVNSEHISFLTFKAPVILLLTWILRHKS